MLDSPMISSVVGRIRPYRNVVNQEMLDSGRSIFP